MQVKYYQIVGKDSFFQSDTSSAMGLLSMLNNEIETNEYITNSKMAGEKKDPKWWIAIVLAFSGLLFGIAVANAQRQLPILEKNRADLRDSISRNILQLDATSDALSAINDDIGNIESSLSDLNYHGILDSNQSSLQILSGLSSVAGKGYEIEINDASRTDPLEFEDISLARVFDSDIQLLVNALWSSGAESISINNQRLTTTTAIRSAGDAILVNYRPLLPPFVISAIGDESMKQKLAQQPDFIDFEFVVKTYGLIFKISDYKELNIPATGVGLPDLQGITVGDRS
jgi:uncharacterized protein YlxW (UPF0749 family)